MRPPWKHLLLRRVLPYGMWTCDNGREVLFNRNYSPIWQRISVVVSAVCPSDRIPWKEQMWFFKDGSTPWGTGKLCKESLERQLSILYSWGDPANGFARELGPYL